MWRLYFNILVLSISQLTFAQDVFLPDANSSHYFEKLHVKHQLDLHADVRPFNIIQFLDSLQLEALTVGEKNQLEWAAGKYQGKKPVLFNAGLLRLLDKNIEGNYINVLPVLNFDFGKNQGQRHYINTRGAEVLGHLSNKVGVYTFIRENQYFFPDYLGTHMAYYNNTIPKQGRYRVFKEDGYDLSESEAYITYSPLRHVQFKFGKYKNFIGNGYRSMLLSENANSYLNIGMRLQFWKIDYQMLLTEMQDYPNYLPSSQMIRRKHSTFHYFSSRITKNITIGFFESVVYDRGDSATNSHFDLNYLNPFVMLRSTEYYIGSPDNALIGVNLYWNIAKKYQVYFQGLLDEFNVDHLIKDNQGWWANKYATQIGGKAYDLFGVEDLDLQLERNFARPFTYSYITTAESYSHASQPLAHPLGANFVENILLIKYRPTKKSFLQLQYMKYSKGFDEIGGVAFGGDIMRNYYDRGRGNDFGHETLQGSLTVVNYISLLYSYEMILGLNIDLSMMYRQDNFTNSYALTRLGLRYNLSYRHFDY